MVRPTILTVVRRDAGWYVADDRTVASGTSGTSQSRVFLRAVAPK